MQNIFLKVPWRTTAWTWIKSDNLTERRAENIHTDGWEWNPSSVQTYSSRYVVVLDTKKKNISILHAGITKKPVSMLRDVALSQLVRSTRFNVEPEQKTRWLHLKRMKIELRKKKIVYAVDSDFSKKMPPVLTQSWWRLDRERSPKPAALEQMTNTSHSHNSPLVRVLRDFRSKSEQLPFSLRFWRGWLIWNPLPPCAPKGWLFQFVLKLFSLAHRFVLVCCYEASSSVCYWPIAAVLYTQADSSQNQLDSCLHRRVGLDEIVLLDPRGRRLSSMPLNHH